MTKKTQRARARADKKPRIGEEHIRPDGSVIRYVREEDDDQKPVDPAVAPEAPEPESLPAPVHPGGMIHFGSSHEGDRSHRARKMIEKAGGT